MILERPDRFDDTHLLSPILGPKSPQNTPIRDVDPGPNNQEDEHVEYHLDTNTTTEPDSGIPRTNGRRVEATEKAMLHALRIQARALTSRHQPWRHQLQLTPQAQPITLGARCCMQHFNWKNRASHAHAYESLSIEPTAKNEGIDSTDYHCLGAVSRNERTHDHRTRKSAVLPLPINQHRYGTAKHSTA